LRNALLQGGRLVAWICKHSGSGDNRGKNVDSAHVGLSMSVGTHPQLSHRSQVTQPFFGVNAPRDGELQIGLNTSASQTQAPTPPQGKVSSVLAVLAMLRLAFQGPRLSRSITNAQSYPTRHTCRRMSTTSAAAAAGGGSSSTAGQQQGQIEHMSVTELQELLANPVLVRRYHRCSGCPAAPRQPQTSYHHSMIGISRHLHGGIALCQRSHLIPPNYLNMQQFNLLACPLVRVHVV